MGPLTKLFINTNTDIEYAHDTIQKYVNKTGYKGFIMVNINNKIIIDIETKYIHQKFNDYDVFISAQSFQQNHITISKQIRTYVKRLIKDINDITCIGGESYLYGLTSNITKIFAYTNSSSIINDILYNYAFYKKILSANLCDYNNIEFIEPSNTCLINLSNLNSHLMKIINDTKFKNIIIINCHHNDFWKKYKLLSNYKIITRYKFISCLLGYFITVTNMRNKYI